MKLNFRYLKIIRFLHPRYYPKNRTCSKKCTKNASASVLITLYMINGNEKEAENEK